MGKFRELQEKLEEDGWLVTRMAPPNDEWWAFEIWVLSSNWRPVGKLVYLTLQIDPMSTIKQSPAIETDVWDISLSHAPPTSRPTGGIKYISHGGLGIVKKWPDIFLAAQMRASKMRNE